MYPTEKLPINYSHLCCPSFNAQYDPQAPEGLPQKETPQEYTCLQRLSVAVYGVLQLQAHIMQISYSSSREICD